MLFNFCALICCHSVINHLKEARHNSLLALCFFFCQDLPVIVWQRCKSSAFKTSLDYLLSSLAFYSEVTVCYITAHENNKESQPEKKGGGTTLWGSSCDPDKIWILRLPIFVTHSLPLILTPPPFPQPVSSIPCGGFCVSAQALRRRSHPTPDEFPARRRVDCRRLYLEQTGLQRASW